MMNRLKGIMLLVLSAVVMFWSPMAWGVGKPKVDCENVRKNSDVIIVGRIESVDATSEILRRSRHGNTYEFGLWKGKVSVQRVIKGKLHKNKIIVGFAGRKKTAFGSGLVMMLETLDPGKTVVMFLRTVDAKEGDYALANDWRSLIRLANTRKVRQLIKKEQKSGNVKDEIATLLTASLEAFSGKYTYRQGISDLVWLKGQQAAPDLKSLLTTQKADYFKTHATLLSVGDYSRLEECVQLVQLAESSDKLPRYVDFTRAGLLSEMSQVEDAELVAKYYIPLLDHSDHHVRQAATYAIRENKVRRAVPDLIEGLEDSDQNVRYQSLMALALIIERHSKWACAKEYFEKHEGKYIERWQKWWKEEGREQFEKEGTKTKAGPDHKNVPTGQ